MKKQPRNQIIPIFFTFDRYYVLAACVAIHSLLKTASSQYQYHLYVVHTGLQDRHQKRLQKVVNKFSNAKLFFKDSSCYETYWDNYRNKAHFSKEIFYKLTAAEMFPEYDRILFSDVDVIFKNDISESFFFYPEEKFYFAGTRSILESKILSSYNKDFSPEERAIISKYEISAGYMLINTKELRADNKQQALMACFRQNANRFILPEQDCIALCCAPHIRFMPYKYGVGHYLFKYNPASLQFNSYNDWDNEDKLQSYREMLDQVIQLHYLGPNKPWNSPFVLKYKEWLKCCLNSGQFAYYLWTQPLFLVQRFKRYSLSRFIRKILRRLHTIQSFI